MKIAGKEIVLKDELLAKDMRTLGNLQEKVSKGELSETDFGFEMVILMIKEIEGEKDIRNFVDNMKMSDFVELSEKVSEKIQEIEKNNKKK